VFLDVPEREWVVANGHAFAIRDRFPVSPGHTLVITRRAVTDWFAASDEERAAVLELVDEVKRGLDAELHPDGYNVGFNAGTAAGQTVMHLHVHVIPRFRGDMDDPRGGVRYVIPSKGNYRHQPAPLATGGESDPFARQVLPLFDRADEIAIVAAFVQDSGLDRIKAAAHGALRRGARIRIVTGDYLDITQASALGRLLDWQRSASGGDEDDDNEAEAGPGGHLLARVVEVERLPPRVRSFHPKSWRFEARAFGVAFVGSSNLSRTALDTGIEWNLRVDRDRDGVAYASVRDAFDALWAMASPLTADWIEAYARRARRTPVVLPPGEVEREALPLPPEPHQVQQEALDALRAARDKGRRRAIVVLATGLGKTWLAAFDFARLAIELGRRPRLLFLAHRRELLLQAAETYRRQLRAMGEVARIGWFVAAADELAADLVFASVSKLARRDHLIQLTREAFDYVVIDEVHHAAAASYRRILDGLDPRFLLGLTATPDRADSADILGLFDDHVAYRADIPRGIAVGRLVPFHYVGVRDDIDYDNIPWRNRRFDPAALAAAAQTEARMQTLWRAWNEHAGGRSLVFCCSIAHADHVREWLRARGVRVAAVYAGEGSDDRETALAALARGELDAVCAVDVFNEGVDVPALDRVIMLRPTESGVVFLQQLGRGLRASDGKSAVTVIDFVGNHRVFLERMRTLLALGGEVGVAALRQFLSSAQGTELPAGCSVDVELEAKDLLSRLLRVTGADEVERAYRELCIERGVDQARSLRPTAGELQRKGYLPGRLRERHGSWFDFVRGEGGLALDELRALEVAGGFLRELEITEMTRCFKMVTLEALLEADALVVGMDVRELAAASHALLRRSPELWSDVADDERVVELDEQHAARWVAYWRRNPIAAWCGPRRDRRAWFRLDGDRFRLDVAVQPELGPPLARLTRELVDYRLAQYRARRREAVASDEGFVCKVLSNQRDPILKLPSRDTARLPEGETDIRLPDGSVWQFRFAREFCNVARPAGSARNQLPDLIRGWFGPHAGQPGTAFQVRFHASPDGLWIEPVQAAVIDIASRRRVVAYPDLRAAAGHVVDAVMPPDAEVVDLPLDDASADLFAVRVSGTSMDGGREPLRDGDWAVMRLARSLPASAVENRVVLIEVHGEHEGAQYQIKRLRRQGHGWQLTSDNPDGPTISAAAGMVPIARLERRVRPEELGPPVGTTCTDLDLPARFGLDQLTPHSGRQAGHLFVFIDRKGMLLEPERLRFASVVARPAETAFVLARDAGGAWRYLGIARQSDERGTWSLPAVDLPTWRAWGEGREVSRRLPEGALARAQLAIDAVLARPAGEAWLQRSQGGRARVLGASARGGLRVDGGDGGFSVRTVSLQDVAWVIVASDDVAENGGLLDEERVNHLRYLEGTPKASTRWIDTGWAIALWNLAKTHVRDAVAADTGLHRVRGWDGAVLDASFRVERVGDAYTVVLESRGGTRGSAAERNTEYAQGLELLLERLGAGGLRIADILAESRETASLPAGARRVALEDRPYPIAIDDAARLRKQISAAQARVGRPAGARGGGNQTRRLRIFLEPGAAVARTELARLLERGRR
jgi:superfamily II DNA or RNA helicase/diadenosine tetraphosphate (Ap4A) HIT family hydrolase/SOS-response transcriptional repressor LexA